MSETYKGYVINTKGDSDWGDREVAFHKSVIDTITTTPPTQIVTHSHTDLIAGQRSNVGSLVHSNECKISVFELPITFMDNNFSAPESINGWVFSPGITGEIISIDGRNVLHVAIPAHTSGTASFNFAANGIAMTDKNLSIISSVKRSPTVALPAGLVLYNNTYSFPTALNMDMINDTWTSQTTTHNTAGNSDYTIILAITGGDGQPIPTGDTPVDLYLDYLTVTSIIDSLYMATINAMAPGDNIAVHSVISTGAFVTTPPVIYNDTNASAVSKIQLKAYCPARSISIDVVETIVSP